MAGQTQQDSMVEGLKKVMSMIAGLMLAPDADPKFLQSLQQGIIGFMQQKAKATMGPRPGGMPGMPPGGPGAGGPPGAPPGLAGALGGLPPAPPNAMGAGGGGGPTGLAPSMPNLDELNRVLGSTGATK